LRFTVHLSKALEQRIFFLEKVTCRKSQISPHFIQREGSLPHSKAPATCPNTEPDQSTPPHSTS